MASTYPRIRIPGPLRYTSTTESGVVEHQEERLLVRDIVRIVFFMPHDHFDLAAGVSHALDRYLRAVKDTPGALREYTCCDWEPAPLSDSGWERIRNTLNPTKRRYTDDATRDETIHLLKEGADPHLALHGEPDGGFGFEYHARLPWREPPPHSVSVLRATLPTEFLEERGAPFVRDLVLDMASQLPLASGHAGLALDVAYSSAGRLDLLRPLIFRHPGFDIRDAGIRDNLGTRVDGVHWMNFLGPPVLRELGGASGLRAKLQSSSTSVLELSGGCVVVTLGPGPEGGDLSHGQTLPAYRELARVLEPWQEPFPWGHLGHPGREHEQEALRQWWRRFLD